MDISIFDSSNSHDEVGFKEIAHNLFAHGPADLCGRCPTRFWRTFPYNVDRKDAYPATAYTITIGSMISTLPYDRAERNHRRG
jgi:hypothetical protein